MKVFAIDIDFVLLRICFNQLILIIYLNHDIMRIANIHDLELELWLKERESGEIKWMQKGGKQIDIRDMPVGYLVNTIRYLEFHEQHVPARDIHPLDQEFNELMDDPYNP